MSKISKKEVLRQLGGSAAEIHQDLRRFSETASILSSDHPRLIDQYPLQWIAVYQGAVSATGKTLKSLITQLRKRKIPPEKTIIRFIGKEERALIL